MIKILALLAALAVGYMAKRIVDEVAGLLKRWRTQPARRRFPDPFEHEYRRGWLWGVACGACASGLVVFLGTLAWEGRLL